MEVLWDIDQIPPDFGHTAVTLGNFDGVHRGHQAVLGQLAELARARGLRSLAITFDPHPRSVHAPDSAPEQITGLTERLARMSETGIDAVLVQRYSLDFADQTAEDFVNDYLVGRLRAKLVAVGRDVRFGRGNHGTIETLKRLGADNGLEIVTIDDVGHAPDTTGRDSSTLVRELLAEGRVDAAAEVLGSPHTVAGTVVHGDARGRELGFPTANLGEDSEGMVPADGVYAGIAHFDSDPEGYPAAISVGTNPTFDGVSRRVEAYVLDKEFADFDVYGSTMSLEFVKLIRGQITFEGMDELIAQMHEDVSEVRSVLS
ncbi:bifunctional riboflavin kinase/FAD synthetase [Brevibacterium luteolum]|uniref:bifunctional riboflavin kinase/FAD synthetase n=1 Tax=Brevibacterium luteolum TaxID=199591 RepID=UPI001FB604F7|nr:bifunctional riboflavin kinase/FAD synthetase [Brevibacterium luteolum]